MQFDKLKVLNIEYPSLKMESYTEETWIFNKPEKQSQIQEAFA